MQATTSPSRRPRRARSAPPTAPAPRVPVPAAALAVLLLAACAAAARPPAPGGADALGAPGARPAVRALALSRKADADPDDILRLLSADAMAAERRDDDGFGEGEERQQQQQQRQQQQQQQQQQPQQQRATGAAAAAAAAAGPLALLSSRLGFTASGTPRDTVYFPLVSAPRRGPRRGGLRTEPAALRHRPRCLGQSPLVVQLAVNRLSRRSRPLFAIATFVLRRTGRFCATRVVLRLLGPPPGARVTVGVYTFGDRRVPRNDTSEGPLFRASRKNSQRTFVVPNTPIVAAEWFEPRFDVAQALAGRSFVARTADGRYQDVGVIGRANPALRDGS